MLLTSREWADKDIIVDGVQLRSRATTYDATVGSIVRCGTIIQSETYVLPPRGMVWVISAERFRLPGIITGLATLRTTWTHNGVLALNVGIVDPGHFGPLATAVVNFGNSDFSIRKGDAFFRIMFQAHAETDPVKKELTMSAYTSDIVQKSRLYSPTFLNTELLVKEVSDKVFGLPKLTYVLTVAAVLIAIIAIFVPISFSVWSDYSLGRTRIAELQHQIDDLKAQMNKADDLESLKLRLDGAEAALAKSLRASRPTVVKRGLAKPKPIHVIVDNR